MNIKPVQSLFTKTSAICTFIFYCLLQVVSVSSQPLEVYVSGALRNIMHAGDISGNIDLADLRDIPHLYALGAMEDLNGEILVLDGETFISRGENGTAVISRELEGQASLLVWASVATWRKVDVPDSVRTVDQFETFLVKMALQMGLDLNKPFPFRLSGNASVVKWHVIRWDPTDTDHTHEKHMRSGPHDQWSDTEVDILGFYSTRHTGIFTHHSSNVHMHVRIKEPVEISGHLDDLEAGSKMILFLPSDGRD